MSSLAQQISEAADKYTLARRRHPSATAMIEASEATREAIFSALLRSEEPCSCAQVVAMTDAARTTVIGHLNVLIKQGRAKKIGTGHDIVYAVVANKSICTHLADPDWLKDLDTID